MKKIMFFRPLYSLGGTEIAMLNLIKNLTGYELYIGYSDETSDMHLLERFSEYAKIVNLNEVSEFEVDVLVACSAHYHLADSITCVKPKKTILWIHHLVNVDSTILADDKRAKELDSIVTVSNTTADILKSKFPNLANKIKAIYNVIDEEEIKELAKEDITIPLSHELNLVTVSRVCKEKGFERMLFLAKALKNNNINFKWFIIGGNYYKEEFDRIYKLYEEFQEYFEWFGFIDNPHNIVKQCDYSVLLSEDETWGLVLTEAMILGVPCISSDFPVAFEQINDGKNGIILNSKEPISYQNRIDDIVKNKDKYKKAVSAFTYKNNDILRSWEEIFNGK